MNVIKTHNIIVADFENQGFYRLGRFINNRLPEIHDCMTFLEGDTILLEEEIFNL